MKVDNCPICGRPVIELDGQFELLQPYAVADGESGDPAAKVFGEVHGACMLASAHGATWKRWQTESFRARGYRLVAADADGWSVLSFERAQPRAIAFHDDGTAVTASKKELANKKRAVEGGVLVEIAEPELNLEVHEPEVIAAMQSKLRASREYPIVDLLAALGTADKLRWPKAIEGGVFVYDKKQERHWATVSVAAAARYAKFIPDAIVPFWKAL